MITVTGGTFSMGCTSEKDIDCSFIESLVHWEKAKNFKLCKFELTQAQWRTIMKQNPSNFYGCQNCPVEYVSWWYIYRFLAKLNKITGKLFLLPTEVEWEFAARGGNESKEFRFSESNELDDVTWDCLYGSERINFVGQKKPNELGLYAMAGNVWEWCSNWHRDGYNKINPGASLDEISNDEFRTVREGHGIIKVGKILQHIAGLRKKMIEK